MLSPLHVGVGVQSITPALGEQLTAYGPCKGIADELLLEVAVFSSYQSRIVLVCLDVLCLRRIDCDAIRAAVASAAEIPKSCVMVSCSHTHYGGMCIRDMAPSFGPFNSGYTERFSVLARDAVTEALANLRPCNPFFGKGSATIGINRRKIEDEKCTFAPSPTPIDSSVPVIVFSHVTDGSPLAIIFQHSCHPTCRDGSNGYCSCDWPGSARRFIEKSFPTARVFFLLGACGDIRPAKFQLEVCLHHLISVVIFRSVKILISFCWCCRLIIKK